MLWATEATTLAALLIASWIHNRDLKEVGLWGTGFACHGFGVALIGLRGHIPDFISIHAGNVLQLCGTAFWCAGLLVYDKKPLRPWLVLPPAIWIVCMMFPDIRASFWARTVVFQATSGLVYGALALLLIEGRRKPRLARAVFSGVALIQAAIVTRMAIEAAIVKPDNFSHMPNVVAYTVGNIFCLVSGIMLGARLLMARTEETLRQLALTDPLTGVLNRRGLFEKFEELRSAASIIRPMIAIVLFDLDHFKKINDQYGHSTGDRVLNAFCEIAVQRIGTKGVFGRLGGEEFACILNITTAAEATGVAEATRLCFMREDMVDSEHDELFRTTVSAGISVAKAGAADLDAMLIAADKALYAAKAAGRNRVVVQDRDTAPEEDVCTGPAPSPIAVPASNDALSNITQSGVWT